ncbi:MAG: polysaccharide biosynthesis C-terminal domain-containing protein [Phaeodactylibacter sp.]|uniref:polysaccharide biosynthesis C-terminal domain-containing protein n=1 Tax=Phaeodactylibacter sp. TaxID=1940289 RepID=UPI0032EF2BD2
MKREFLLNIIFLLAANLLIKPFYLFGIDRTVQNTVPESEYGLYFALFNFTFLFQIVNDFGIQNYNNRHIAQHGQLLIKYFPNFIILKGLLSLIYLALVLSVGWWAGYTLPHFSLLLFIAFNQILFSLVLYLRSNVSGLGHYRLDSLLSVTDRLLLIVICSFLLWGDLMPAPFRIEWFVWAQTASLSITALLSLGIVSRKLPRFRFRVHTAFLWYLLRESAPYALSIFLMSAYYRLDGIMIEQLLPDGPREAGLYASAYRLYEAANMVGFLFAGLLLPIFSRMLAGKEAIAPLACFSFKLITLSGIILLVGVGFYSTEIMQLLYTSGSAYSGKILLFLCGSYLAVAGTYVFGTLLVASNNTRQLNYVFGIGLAINLSLNLLLIPTLKAQGAAMATLATQVFILTGELFVARRQLQLKVPVNVWGQLAGAALLLLAMGWSIQIWTPLGWHWSFLSIIALGGLIALSFVLRSGQVITLREGKPAQKP